MRTAARSCATALGCRPGQAKNRLWSKHVFQTVVDVQGVYMYLFIYVYIYMGFEKSGNRNHIKGPPRWIEKASRKFRDGAAK